VESLILRHPDDLSETKSTSQKDIRPEMPYVFLANTIRCLREYVDRMKAELRSSLNEVGMSESQDDKPKKVSVPKTTAGEIMHHNVSRIVKHTSIVACITAAGDSLMA
jgi:hypothetical protein